MKPEGSAVVNTRKGPSEVDLGVSVRCATVDATSVALEHIKAPIVNTSILGSMAKVQDLVSLDSIKAAIADRFGERLGPAGGRDQRRRRPGVLRPDQGRYLPGQPGDRPPGDVAAELAGHSDRGDPAFRIVSGR